MQLNYTKHKDTSRGITFGLHFLVQMLPKNPKTHPKSLLHVPHSEVLALPGSSAPQASNRNCFWSPISSRVRCRWEALALAASGKESSVRPSVCPSVCCMREATRVSETRRAGANQPALAGKTLRDDEVWALAGHPAPVFPLPAPGRTDVPVICGMAGGCPEQPGQNHGHLPECCQPPRSQTRSAVTAGADVATRSGTRFIPDPPRCQNKTHPSEGRVALASLKTPSVSGGDDRGAPSHTKVGFRSSLKFTTGWGPPCCSVRWPARPLGSVSVSVLLLPREPRGLWKQTSQQGRWQP